MAEINYDTAVITLIALFTLAGFMLLLIIIILKLNNHPVIKQFHQVKKEVNKLIKLKGKYEENRNNNSV